MPNPEKLSMPGHPEVERYILSHVEKGHWPQAAYAFGPCSLDPSWCGGTDLGSEGLFDLASLTKGLFTAVAVCRLAARGELDLDQELSSYLPEMLGYAGRTPSLRSLLSHDAGLSAWAPIYRIAKDPSQVPSDVPSQVAAAISRLPPDRPAGSGPVYSCLGPILAGFVLERASSRSLRELLDEEIRQPLGIRRDDLFFAPAAPEFLSRVLPTETGRKREAEMAAEWCKGREEESGDSIVPGPDIPILGQVHDGNACFLGGAAGNAGLFATARAVFRIASALSCDEEFLPAGLRDELATPCARSAAEVRTFGFESGTAPSAPAGALGPASFGHVGFAGTSVWTAGERGPVAVLLTNRIHPRWSQAPMQQWRQRFHNIVAGQLE